MHAQSISTLPLTCLHLHVKCKDTLTNKDDNSDAYLGKSTYRRDKKRTTTISRVILYYNHLKLQVPYDRSTELLMCA